MGITKYIMLAALVAAAPATVSAQDNGAAPILQDFRLDPSRDTSRPRPPERAGPEIGPVPDAVPLPSVTAPPVTAPRVTAPPVATPPVASPTLPQTRAPTGAPAPRATPARPQPPAASVPDSVLPPEAAQEPGLNATEPVGDALEAPVAAPAPASAVEPDDASNSRLPWILGGVVVILLLAGAFLFRRRRAEDPEDEVEIQAEPAPAVLVQTAKPSPPLNRIERTPPPAPQPPAPAPVSAATGDSLLLTFAPVHARVTMAGAQLGYNLTLHNRSAAALDGMAVTAFIANADASQPQMLAAFFDDPFAPEAHRIAGIAAGEAITVSGELRLTQFVPTEVQGRALLIPLVAFKVISLDGDEMARGAFIVGQESSPPRAKMAPFRLDQGPRQFRDVGSRPAQDLIAA
ncbi:MAG: hypothetical protein QHC67_15655 [Sphingobium sp.]|uniref:hypothetical protein n=1 Tax=Sphingobium sp. TaxID=1912891 RepID=UPI0029B073A5|nr:hypothetical protein [Sphingobium sp.]MDX3911234.1 hypothetical protein [Sphingobium sp.]